jgi:FkbM family methyltransferase
VADRLNRLQYHVNDESDYIFAANNPLLLWRARTLFTKEPETIQWIRSLSPEDVLYDVGANVGIYSIYAGFRCARVFSFEPESGNFSVLNQNIRLNGLSDRITAYPLALSDRTQLDMLRLSDARPGAALHSFAADIDFRGQPFKPVFRQGALAVTLDSLIFDFGLQFPTHIKLDVDGLEAAIVRGGAKSLADLRLKSILIEINENLVDHVAAKESLVDLGFVITNIGEVAHDAVGSSRMRNYIFKRE